MAKTVTKIPQTRNLFTTAPIATTARRKVAGYARVSTDSDEQFTSYEAQVDDPVHIPPASLCNNSPSMSPFPDVFAFPPSLQ